MKTVRFNPALVLDLPPLSDDEARERALGEKAPIPLPEGLPVGFDASAVGGAAQLAIAAYTDAWWEQFSATTRRALRRQIANAEALGYTMDELIVAIEPLFGPQRAEAIAVTETTRLLGLGAQETYRAAGFIAWEWRTVNDAIVDQVCTDLDGEVFPISMPFEPAHVNCRCWPVPQGDPIIPSAIAPYVSAPYLV